MTTNRFVCNALAVFAAALGIAALSVTSCKPKGAEIAVSGISVSQPSISITEGETATISYTVEPSDASHKGVSFSSSDPSVATVSDNGVVTAISPGTAVITVTTSDGGFTATVSVTVKAKGSGGGGSGDDTKVKVTGITLNESDVTIAAGSFIQLVATVTPENATDKTVEWKSSKPSAVVVDDDGKVSGIMAGSATITATTKDGGFKATCDVLVKDVAAAGYDFLHLSYYTFNTGRASGSFIQKLDFTGNDGSVTWWTHINPRYETGDGDISFRHALKKYDVSYINLAELAFNVVDKNDAVMSDVDIAAAGLSVEFSTIGATDYSSLWKSPAVFYYKSKEPFIRMQGKLFLNSGGTKIQLPTRFSKPKASVAYPAEVLDYSSYALVPWRPFKDITLAKDTYTISLDEHKKYVVALAGVTGLALKDNRPNGVSYDVFKDNGWVTGNVTTYNWEAGTYTPGGNGYISGVSSRRAYGITPRAAASVPAELKKIMSVKYSADGVKFADEQNSDGSLMPYFVVDYISSVEFSGEVNIPVTIKFESPWQDVSADCTIVVKGV